MNLTTTFTRKTFLMFSLSVTLISSITLSSCSNNDDPILNKAKEKKSTSLFTSKAPFLICANRNPQGIGFDFWYKNEEGGANDVADPIIKETKDIAFDMIIRTIKATLNDTPKGCPFIQLFHNAKACNYTAKKTDIKGKKDFDNLTKISLTEKDFNADKAGFNVNDLPINAKGFRDFTDVNTEYKKLVIGNKWIKCLKNQQEDDEVIWIIKTSENKYFKMMVREFPAKNAPTANGYCIIEWGIVKNQ